MSYPLFLAKRYLVSRRHGIFALLTTLIAVGGTSLGVAALIITLSVMDGFRTDIQEKILGTQPHVLILSSDGQSPFKPAARALQLCAADRSVQASAPFVQSQVLLTGNGPVSGAILRGIDPARERRVTRLDSILKKGGWSTLEKDGGVVIGAELAYNLNVRIGESIGIVPPTALQDAASARAIQKVRITGIFQSGMYDYDSRLLFVSIGTASRLLRLAPGQVSGIGLKVGDPAAAIQAARRLQTSLGPSYWVRSWQDMNRNLFSAMKLEKTVMFLILTLIILVACFTIISNLLLLTVEKSRDIGILKALGAPPAGIRRLFQWLGLFLGGTGVTLGILLGTGASWVLKRVPIIKLPADVYYIDTLPIDLRWGNVAAVALCAFLLVLIATLYPAKKASEVDPVEAIRYG